MPNRITRHLTKRVPPACLRARMGIDPRAECPGPDGIRHALVAQIRANIAAGVYDSDDIWSLAEERLFDRIENPV